MDSVTVRIPASPQYVSVVRLIAASLGARLGFTIDEIEDLKIGVDELAGYLTGRDGRDGTLEIRFAISGDSIEIAGGGDFESRQRAGPELSDFSRRILETVVDSAALDPGDTSPSFRLSKSRRA
jgi:hypothetical protein